MFLKYTPINTAESQQASCNLFDWVYDELAGHLEPHILLLERRQKRVLVVWLGWTALSKLDAEKTATEEALVATTKVTDMFEDGVLKELSERESRRSFIE